MGRGIRIFFALVPVTAVQDARIGCNVRGSPGMASDAEGVKQWEPISMILAGATPTLVFGWMPDGFSPEA